MNSYSNCKSEYLTILLRYLFSRSLNFAYFARLYFRDLVLPSLVCGFSNPLKNVLNTQYFILRRKRREWLPHLPSQRLMFKRSMNSRSNWNLEMLVFKEGGKPEYPEKNPRSKDEN